jgi:hypothetical protein
MTDVHIDEITDKIIDIKISDKEIIWKDFPADELKSTFLISNTGKIKEKISNKILDLKAVKSGYKCWTKYNVGYKIHIMVALAFIPNPDNKACVNHKNGDKYNNNVENLEWMTIKENNDHAWETGLQTKTERKVIQYDLDDVIINKFDTIRGAGVSTQIDSGGIAKCCKGTRNTAGGFKWKFAEKNPNEKEINKDDYIQVNNFKNYLINKNGDIYSKPYKKILKQQKNADGYMSITLNNKGKRTFYLTHRLIAENFIANNDLEKTQVKFIDKDKTNLTVSNLHWTK